MRQTVWQYTCHCPSLGGGYLVGVGLSFLRLNAPSVLSIQQLLAAQLVCCVAPEGTHYRLRGRDSELGTSSLKMGPGSCLLVFAHS